MSDAHGEQFDPLDEQFNLLKNDEVFYQMQRELTFLQNELEETQNDLMHAREENNRVNLIINRNKRENAN